MKYRILEKIFSNGNRKYVVQVNPLFGLPLFWFTYSYCSLTPPHPDLTVPAFCTLRAVYNTLEDAQKCLNALTHKNKIKIIKSTVIKLRKNNYGNN